MDRSEGLLVRSSGASEDITSGPSALLRSVAEELKVPLLQIAREAELHVLNGEGVNLSAMQARADMALMLIDSYLLGLELNELQTELALEPVSLSSVLNDAAHTLDRFAKQYDTKFELACTGKYGPVMAHAGGMKAALLSLGYSLVSVPPAEAGQRRVMLGVHQSARGLVAGVYGDFEALAQTQLRQARVLFGRARQPLQIISGGSAVGVFVADMIFQAMHTSLGVSRHLRHTGLAATLQPSKQLNLV